MRAIHRLFLSCALLLGAAALPACGVPEDDAAALTQSQAPVDSHAAAQVVTCPNPKSCGSWSTWYNIGTPSCVASDPSCAIEVCRPCHCTQDGCDECCTVRQRNGQYQTQESFRDCRLANNSPCREKREQTVLLSCGSC